MRELVNLDILVYLSKSETVLLFSHEEVVLIDRFGRVALFIELLPEHSLLFKFKDVYFQEISPNFDPLIRWYTLLDEVVGICISLVGLIVPYSAEHEREGLSFKLLQLQVWGRWSLE